MKRAAILISVKKTGNLPELQASTHAVEDMHRWTQAQHFDIVEPIYDSRPVGPERLKTAIKRLIELGTIEQLVVYFTGTA